jgi:F-box-like
MSATISAQLPDELLLDIFVHSISDYGLIDDFLAGFAAQRLTLPLHAQFSSLEEWKRRTQTLLYLSRVAKSWFRVATPLLYASLRVHRPTMTFALIRASSGAPVLLEHTKHLSFEIGHSGDAGTADESDPNSSHAFKKLASRCPNLCVLQSRCIELNGNRHPIVLPSLRLYGGLLHPLVSSSQTTLQYLILHDDGAPMSHNLQGLSFPLLHVLDLTQTAWINYPIIMSWDMPTLRELRGCFSRERVSFDIIAKVAKTLRRLQIQISHLDESWGLSGSDIDKPISLPQLNEVIIHIEDEVYVGLHPRYFAAFCSLDSLHFITMNVPRKLKAFIMTVASFTRAFEGSAIPRNSKPVTIRIGEASLKPQISEWSTLSTPTVRHVLVSMVHKLNDYGANVSFAMPDGTYEPFYRFANDCLILVKYKP